MCAIVLARKFHILAGKFHNLAGKLIRLLTCDECRGVEYNQIGPDHSHTRESQYPKNTKSGIIN